MIIHSLPPSATTLFPSCEIKLKFNITNNPFEPFTNSFSYVTDKTNVRLMRLDPRAIYILERLTVSASIDQNTFFDSVLEPLQLKFSLEKDANRSQNFPDNYQINTINFPHEMSTIFYSLSGDDFLQISAVSGRLTQLSNMVDIESIKLRVSAVVHRTTNSKFVDKIKAEWNGGK